MWARIQDGVVAELTAEDPKDRFHPDLVWHPIPASMHGVVGERWVFSDGVFTPPPAPEVIETPQPTLADLRAELAAVSAKIEALAAR